MHTSPNISQGKNNQAMKFGQLIENNKRNIFFFQKSCRKCGRGTSSRTLFFKKKALYQAKASVLQLGFNIFR